MPGELSLCSVLADEWERRIYLPYSPTPPLPCAPRALPPLLIMPSRSTHPTLGRKLGFIRLSGQNEKADYDECPFVRRSNSRLPKIRLLLEQLTFLAVPVEAR